jgi:poly(hydroxyalkanoate) granule-associated protein
MVKKLKAMAEGAGKDSHLAAAVKESAQQIWLAGLGAFAKAQEEGGKVFEALVKEGGSIQKRTMKVTEDRVQEVTDRMQKFAGQFSKQAGGTWDKLEGVFEERVQRALGRLGVPNAKEVSDLTKRVEELTAAVQKLSGGRAVKKAPAKKAAKRPARAAKPAQ